MDLEQAVSRAQQAIAEDRARGVVPTAARSWAALHDYVDANEYLQDAQGALLVAEADVPELVRRLDQWLAA